MPEEWTAWVLDSPGAVRVGRAVCAAAGIAWTVAAGIVLVNLARGRAVPGITLLLVPGIPTLVAGQLWGIAILLGRRNRAEGGPPRWRYRSKERDPRRLFFEGLPSRQANAVLALAILGWLAAITAIPSFLAGSPAAPSRHCRYRLVDHGAYICVSRSKYLAAGAGTQRFAGGILGAFFVVQFGMAAAELRRRRVAQSQALV